MKNSVQITKKGFQRWKKGHPWIFRSDLSHIETESAGLINIYSPDKTLIGQGLYSPMSLIAIRTINRSQKNINIHQLLEQRIQTSLKIRERIFPSSSVYRLAFAEADGLPSLIIDRYQDVLVFQSLSAGMEVYKDTIIEILKKHLKPKSIIERNDAPVRKKEGLEQITQCVYGNDFKEIEISINGKYFFINPLEGQKTGFFLDQRFNAQVTAGYAHGKLLDCFCNSGQFSIFASQNIENITALDISQSTLQLSEKNFIKNQIKQYQLLEENAFDYLKQADENKMRFDTIILDPPAFVKHKSALRAAERGYKEINLRALKILNSGGILASFTCSQNISWELFKKVLSSAAKDSKRNVRILATLQQAPDHPQVLAMPESEYLKGMILEVES